MIELKNEKSTKKKKLFIHLFLFFFFIKNSFLLKFTIKTKKKKTAFVFAATVLTKKQKKLFFCFSTFYSVFSDSLSTFSTNLKNR